MRPLIREAGEWHQVFQGERMTAALLNRLTHRRHIFEMNSEIDKIKGSGVFVLDRTGGTW
jgi:hypothetical protein